MSRPRPCYIEIVIRVYPRMSTIAVGEELTEDYRYCLDWPEWAHEHLGR